MGIEMHAISLNGTTTAHAQCDDGDFREDAPDLSMVQDVLSHGAMHSASTGHTVHESVVRNITVSSAREVLPWP